MCRLSFLDVSLGGNGLAEVQGFKFDSVAWVASANGWENLMGFGHYAEC